MEQHGATNCMSSSGQFILAKECRDDFEKWTPGLALRRTGRVTHDVDLQSFTWVCHANQARPPFHPVAFCSSTIISLEFFLDISNKTPDVSATAPNPEAHAPSALPKGRRIVPKGKLCICR
ncbi:hypothetical protein P879_00303 [Paragonimus westermani]|uniref:Uncharacterized protein n=1 Tax=Paragonimus westermani TaxID=34504 RepID=A0A8T0DTF8_9TREM|nr:hypothetical protein P879_00303 [Paragonimus westermani]